MSEDDDNRENTITVNSPMKIRRSNALTSASGGKIDNALTVVSSKQKKQRRSENPIPPFETTLLGSLQKDNAGHFHYHADIFITGVLGHILTIVAGRGDRHFGFYYEGKEFVFDVFQGMAIYLSQTLGVAKFRQGTNKYMYHGANNVEDSLIILANHIIDCNRDGPSVICGASQLRSGETLFLSVNINENMTVATHKIHQFKLPTLLKSPWPHLRWQQ